MTDQVRDQKGYSLIEVLIAAAIAAGVVAASARGIALASRLAVASAAATEEVEEVRSIIARLKAGMSDSQALEGFSGWEIVRRPLENKESAALAAFDEIHLSRAGRSGAPYVVWAAPGIEADD